MTTLIADTTALTITDAAGNVYFDGDLNNDRTGRYQCSYRFSRAGQAAVNDISANITSRRGAESLVLFLTARHNGDLIELQKL